MEAHRAGVGLARAEMANVDLFQAALASEGVAGPTEHRWVIAGSVGGKATSVLDHVGLIHVPGANRLRLCRKLTLP